MLKSIAFFYLLITNILFAQKTPEIYKQYSNTANPLINDHLILSNDSLFFYYSSCECGEVSYAKGNWEIKGDFLYLKGFDSSKAFPHSTVNFISGDLSDSVTISGINYFKKPIRHLAIGLIYNDTVNFHTTIGFADSLGKLKVSKREFGGFYLLYEADGNKFTKTVNPFHTFEENTEEIKVYIDFSEATFDEHPKPFNYGKQVYRIINNKLYDKKNKQFFVVDTN